ncbi:MAG: RNA polymerase sigma factor SigZ [Planctomycetes bacterium]|nr:RNA polymerase sigma factor SigZ [Planctomycetota bacterium]
MNDQDLELAWPPLQQQLQAFVRRRVRDRDAADDIVQDVFVKLATRLAESPDRSALHAWVFQVARHAVIDWWRTRRPLAELPAEFAVPAADPPRPGDPEWDGLCASFRSFVHALPPKYREAVLLTEYEGLTQKELAERLGIALSTAKSRVQRGRRQLQKVLLDCCSFELDRRGQVIDWQRRRQGGCPECG